MDERIKKLPAWAQDAINDLARERGTAVNALNRYLVARYSAVLAAF